LPTACLFLGLVEAGDLKVAFFLRDKHVQSVEVDEARLRQFIQIFEGFLADKTAGMQPLQAATEWFLSYIVRLDEKGYKVFSGNEVINLFTQADVVERVILSVDSKLSLNTNRQQGTWVELKLDAFTVNNSWLNVASENRTDVDAMYAVVDGALTSAKNRFGVARSAPARFAIQLVGVILCFVLSLWGASVISSRLAVQNAFPLAFLFVFVLFSNAWTFIQPWALRRIDRLFPNVYFKRASRERWTWLWQTLVASAIFAVLTALALVMFNYIAAALNPFIVSK
jgi:hypothetical protein